jgi:hypothetical protein
VEIILAGVLLPGKRKQDSSTQRAALEENPDRRPDVGDDELLAAVADAVAENHLPRGHGRQRGPAAADQQNRQVRSSRHFVTVQAIHALCRVVTSGHRYFMATSTRLEMTTEPRS